MILTTIILKESLHNETNNDGRKRIQFMISKGLNVRSTTFPHKDVHKETWYSADSMTANQIDHVLISNRFRSAISDIRALWGPEVGSDHNLLKMNFKVKLSVKTGNKYNERRKMVNIFQNPKWKQEYDIEINNKFEILENLYDEDGIDNDINEKWENIKTRIKETKEQLIEKDEGTGTFKNTWYDEECKLATEEIKKAREKWLIKGRRESRNITTRKAAHKIIRNKKKTYMKNVTESIALRIINEKLWEYNQSVQYLFIDFQKAYNSIYRDAVWKCMKEFNIPNKLINTCKTCVQKTRSEVRIEGTLSSFFENKTGLTQGDPLSPILFNLA